MSPVRFQACTNASARRSLIVSACRVVLAAVSFHVLGRVARRAVAPFGRPPKSSPRWWVPVHGLGFASAGAGAPRPPRSRTPVGAASTAGARSATARMELPGGCSSPCDGPFLVGHPNSEVRRTLRRAADEVGFSEGTPPPPPRPALPAPSTRPRWCVGLMWRPRRGGVDG